MSKQTSLKIEICKEIADFHTCEDLQLEIWGGREREIIPYDIMIAMSKCGGTLIGAWDEANLIGLALSFIALKEGTAHHYLHLLGVLPGYRNWNVGFELMIAARTFVIAQGLKLITWTFDPLESVNAHLYFYKLGGISKTYIPDCYGAMPEVLNAGLSSDRLLVEWDLEAPNVISLLGHDEQSKTQNFSPNIDQLINIPCLVKMDNNDFPKLLEENFRLASEKYRIENPPDIQSMKNKHFEKAQSWRLCTQQAFTWAIANGYVVKNYFRPIANRSGCYLLVRN